MKAWVILIGVVLLCLNVFADESVSLVWIPSPDPRAEGNTLLYGTQSGIWTESINIEGNKQTTVTVKDLKLGFKYYFAIFAWSRSLNLQSDLSNIVEFTPMEGYWKLPVLTDQEDTNHNGFEDAWEMRVYGNLTTARTDLDSDGDGFRDWREYVSGTNPLDKNDYPRVSIALSDGKPAISFKTIPTNQQEYTNRKRYYTLMGTKDLINWEPVDEYQRIPGDGTEVALLPIGQYGFYRLEVILE